MKKIMMISIFCIFSNITDAQSFVPDKAKDLLIANSRTQAKERQEKIKTAFKYKTYYIDKDLLIHNLECNIESWLDYTFSVYENQKRKLCVRYYRMFLEAIKKNQVYVETDGIVHWYDIDQDKYWFDKDDNYITNSEYLTLKERKQKLYDYYIPANHVPIFIKIVAESIYNAGACF